MRHVAYYNTDELEAELRTIGVQFGPATSDYEWWEDNMKNFGETQDPAAAKRQRTDIYGIQHEHIHGMASAHAFPINEILELAKLTVDQMKSRLMFASQSFNSKAKQKELFDLLIGLKVMERRRTGGRRNDPMSEGL